MYITSIRIRNFKGYKELDLELNQGMNILVGDNEAKKTTILEAINLVLSGSIDGRYLTSETLNDFLFNKECSDEYKKLIEKGDRPEPPSIIIELHFSDDAPADYQGAENIEGSRNAKGIYYRIALRQDYLDDYRKLSKDNLTSLPLELYSVEIKKFSGHDQSRALLPIKNSFIDTSSNFQNASDQTIAKIIKSDLSKEEKIKVSQFYRGIKETYKGHPIHAELNKHIKHKDSTISIDPSSKNSWDSHLSVYVKEIPFSYIGKGLQTIIKTSVSLSSAKTESADVVLIEEPENHLSHTSLGELMELINNNCKDKQIIVTSHSSFVANKLGLNNLILLDNGNPLPFIELKPETKDFFVKLPGYDTLRFLLSKKVILVEGDADELIVQRAFLDNHGVLPINSGIDVISVNNTHDRFFQIAKPIGKQVALIIDVDTRIEDRINLKTELSGHPNLEIFFEENDPYAGGIELYNNNTLEPLLLKYNGREKLNGIFEKEFKTDDELLSYMKKNKTNCALLIFSNKEKINYPKYILDAIEFILK